MPFSLSEVAKSIKFEVLEKLLCQYSLFKINISSINKLKKHNKMTDLCFYWCKGYTPITALCCEIKVEGNKVGGQQSDPRPNSSDLHFP
ncbi:hypothetical protein [Xenorhabdus lircayensis]|uniref:Uncharacterized protein n=1 Tax=Xenorhabdus lircayensis TaxID=2763499 RepID=A0ABS0U7H0_9GAMM|nr:hypothetical protein [Xenorhabdus lircayensis]MBI6549830.1 hypothetical protein [Xenorhabdus lircayensis]